MYAKYSEGLALSASTFSLNARCFQKQRRHVRLIGMGKFLHQKVPLNLGYIPASYPYNLMFVVICMSY